MSVEILFNAIQEYAYPLLEAAGLRMDPYGHIVDMENKKLAMRNPRYNENDPQEGVSPILYPVIPIKDEDYLSIKEKPELELFNPFSNLKHMIAIAVKMKPLATVDLSPTLTNTAVDEDDWAKFDDYIGLSNDVNSFGEIDYALVDLYESTRPEILRYPCPQDEPVKGLWALCVLMYNRYVSQRPPYLKQFQDIEKSWKKIRSAMNKWDKVRKTIVAQVHKEDNQSMNVEYMDLSDSVTPGQAINVFTMPKELTGDDFLMVEDGADINDAGLQNFLTSLFDKEDLIPVDEEDRTETIVEDISNETPAQMLYDMAKDNPAISVTKLEPESVPEPVKEEPSNSIFKKSSSAPSQQINFNNPGMYGGMMYGGMNPGMGFGYQPRPVQTMNYDDLCLGDVIDPYANYR